MKKDKKRNSVKSYFSKLFSRYDFRNEKRVIHLGKWLIFALLLFVEAFILMQFLSEFDRKAGIGEMMFLVIAIGTLTLFEWLKLFVVNSEKSGLSFYFFDLLVACSFLFVEGGIYALLIYVIVLTALYIGAEKKLSAFTLFCIGVLLYTGCYALQIIFRREGNIDVLGLVTDSLATVVTLLVHFLIVQFALAFYRQFVRLNKTLRELDESKKELEKAYAVVAEVSALEERQRIAKEIHDTAGHSITTVIMQTEMAKLIALENPAEAKQKIISANLQAKHALEELRDSVHLLSGTVGTQTLKTALEGIIHESTDGTDIVIRSEIEEINVSQAKFRFLCNTLKEGISNAFRHGGATAFWFECKKEENKIRFLLSDNGKGADLDTLELGFGLKSMKDRAKSLGGDIRFTSELGEGFEIEMFLPQDTEEKDGKRN